MTLAEPGSPCSLPRNGGHAVESLALAHCGRPTSFTRCWGGPGTPWPCQARGCGRNIENFGDGQRLPKLRVGCSSDHPSELRRSCGGTCSSIYLRLTSSCLHGSRLPKQGRSGDPTERCEGPAAMLPVLPDKQPPPRAAISGSQTVAELVGGLDAWGLSRG